MPGARIGPLALGMTETELVAAWSAIPRWARNAEGLSDDAPPAPVLPHYDAAGRATRIGVMIEQPVPVMVQGKDLRRRPDHEVDELLRTFGATEGGYGSTSVPSAGIDVTKWERSDGDYLMVDVFAPGDPLVMLPRRDPSTALGRLLGDVYDRPEDDAVRLVYADALIEAGDPRGEFIVRQLRGDPAGDLVARYGRRWLGELAPLLAEYRFERGFLAAARVVGPLGALIDHDVWGTLRALAGSAELARRLPDLRTLEIEERELADPVAFLAEDRPPLEQLHFVLRMFEDWDQDGDITATPMSGGVWTTHVAEETVLALARCTVFPNLRELFVEGPAGAWVQQLAASPIARRARFRYEET